MTNRRTFLAFAGAAALIAPKIGRAQGFNPELDALINDIRSEMRLGRPISQELALLRAYIELFNKNPPVDGAYQEALRSYDSIVDEVRGDSALISSLISEGTTGPSVRLYAANRDKLLSYIAKTEVFARTPTAIERAYLTCLIFVDVIAITGARSARWCIWPIQRDC
ncbi:hypothetical protein IZ6_21050 [Terrihabitans soli]|uniref:Uncharacterized protein n=1 Tax=Terrihabitans soli TaxID=708113 RepID=A0A6S6QWG5_9HYPH|nr:hypothetical protein [Terrihabitans soli]BCJ91370.1 hypothetical protein IZ6_21050 [Terrihabitans soli]